MERAARLSAVDASSVGDEIRRCPRLEAAKLQIEMAIRARMLFDDVISAFTLAGAAEHVLSDLQPKDAKVSEGFDSLKAVVNEYVDVVERTKLFRRLRFNYDQLRHADKHPEHEHVLNVQGVDMLILLSIWAFAGRPKGAEPAFAEWFYKLPPILAAFVIWMFLNYPSDTWERRPDDNFPELKVLRNNQPLAFEAILHLVEAKSLIPNPKSLHEQAQP